MLLLLLLLLLRLLLLVLLLGSGLLSNQGEKSINFYFIRVPLRKKVLKYGTPKLRLGLLLLLLLLLLLRVLLLVLLLGSGLLSNQGEKSINFYFIRVPLRKKVLKYGTPKPRLGLLLLLLLLLLLRVLLLVLLLGSGLLSNQGEKSINFYFIRVPLRKKVLKYGTPKPRLGLLLLLLLLLLLRVLLLVLLLGSGLLSNQGEKSINFYFIRVPLRKKVLKYGTPKPRLGLLLLLLLLLLLRVLLLVLLLGSGLLSNQGEKSINFYFIRVPLRKKVLKYGTPKPRLGLLLLLLLLLLLRVLLLVLLLGSGLLSNQGEKSINFYFIRVPLRKKY